MTDIESNLVGYHTEETVLPAAIVLLGHDLIMVRYFAMLPSKSLCMYFGTNSNCTHPRPFKYNCSYQAIIIVHNVTIFGAPSFINATLLY